MEIMAEVLKMRKTDSTSNLSIIADEFAKKMDAETVCRVAKASEHAIMICMEQYYFRVGNYVALTVLFTQEETSLDAVLVGSGGGSGMSNFS